MRENGCSNISGIVELADDGINYNINLPDKNGENVHINVDSETLEKLFSAIQIQMIIGKELKYEHFEDY